MLGVSLRLASEWGCGGREDWTLLYLCKCGYWETLEERQWVRWKKSGGFKSNRWSHHGVLMVWFCWWNYIRVLRDRLRARACVYVSFIFPGFFFLFFHLYVHIFIVRLSLILLVLSPYFYFYFLFVFGYFYFSQSLFMLCSLLSVCFSSF